ncbi:Dynein regulatory complex protein 8 [Thoreauomyces humboldtii]|nr:Dynein regulatory complex protein 8 [Thoreauomyces humboldtii]
MPKRAKSARKSASAPADPIEAIVTEETRVALLKKIKKAFDTFDQAENQTCDAREVGTIIRSLGIFPSEEQLRTWTAEAYPHHAPLNHLTSSSNTIYPLQMESPEKTGYISYDRLCKVAFRLLTSNTLRDDEEKLYRAFLALDSDGKGFLTPDELRQFMTSEGEPFSGDEMEEMLMACTDPTDGKIWFEDYVTILAQ